MTNPTLYGFQLQISAQIRSDQKYTQIYLVSISPNIYRKYNTCVTVLISKILVIFFFLFIILKKKTQYGSHCTPHYTTGVLYIISYQLKFNVFCVTTSRLSGYISKFVIHHGWDIYTYGHIQPFHIIHHPFIRNM